LDAHAYHAGFVREQARNRAVLLGPQGGLPGSAEALDRLDAALRDLAPRLHERVRASQVLDGHGDLRPEHVCLERPPVVIDCLEFNAELRRVDPFDEIAFLALECEMAGAAWVGERLWEGCARALPDPAPPALRWLYTAYRALLRARLALAHLLDPSPRTPSRWVPLTLRYIGRALQALDALDALNPAGQPPRP
jgi:aminoglycoside phosphotransferase family enzyme